MSAIHDLDKQDVHINSLQILRSYIYRFLIKCIKICFHPVAKPFVEVGAQFNFCKAKLLDAIIGERKWTMLDPYMGQSYVPGAQMNTYDIVYGGPGYGLSFAAGLKIVVAKSVSIDPTFYGCMASYGIKPLQERSFNFNYGVIVRIVINDYFLGRRR